MKRFTTGSTFKFRGRKFYGLRGFKGKPFHPPLTDLPVAAYVIGPIFDLLAFIGRDAEWGSRLHSAAGYTLLAGAAFSLLTVATGFADWLDTEKGTPIRAMANAHAWSMVGVTALVATNLAIRYLGDTGGETGVGLLVLSLVIAVAVTLGSAIGGAMAFDYGFNVRTSKDDPVYHPYDEQPPAEPLRRTG